MSNATGVAAERGVRSRYVPVVLATIQLSRTSTPSLSLKPMPTPAGPRAPARTLPSTCSRLEYMTKIPTMFGLDAAVADDRVVRVHEVRAVPAAPHDVPLEQDAARVPDDDVARVLHDAPAHDGVGRLPELDAVAPQLGHRRWLPRTRVCSSTQPGHGPNVTPKSASSTVDVGDARAGGLGLDAGVLGGVPAPGVTDREVVDPDVVRRDRERPSPRPSLR